MRGKETGRQAEKKHQGAYVKKNRVQKSAIVGAVILFVVLFLVFDLERFLTLDYLKASQEKFHLLYADNQVLVVSLYILIYVIVTALSLPGAVVMTLAGGALFGLVIGTVAVSIASTVGATLACFASRFILRDWVQAKFGGKLQAINEGVEREGGFYLFTVRLIPVFPFFVINLVMGLTSMPLRTFFWVSQLGMLPGTLVFVNAGKELGKIQSAADILSPTLLISFVVLGLFPITVKKIMALLRKNVAGPDKEVSDDKI